MPEQLQVGAVKIFWNIFNNETLHRQKADRTCEEDAPLPQPRVASSAEAGVGAGPVIAAILCILALIVVSVLGVTFVRWVVFFFLLKSVSIFFSSAGDFAYYQD